MVPPIEKLVKRLENKYNGVDLLVSRSGEVLCIADLTVPKRKRNKGVGTKIMRALTQFADRYELKITLMPYSSESDLGRLTAFYKRFGFKKNPITKNMSRKPRKIS
jgi:predicted N-acetyltransferase YhbS